MDFSFTAEQARLQEAAAAFAREELHAGYLEREERGEFDRAGWNKCADFGIQRMPLPRKYGGEDRDPLTCLLVMQALGYGCRDAGLLFSINSHIWTCEMPILHFGTEQQKEKYLPPLARGSIVGGHAMTEPGSGSDAFSLRARAILSGDRYVLNGTKTFITNAPIADILIVFARLEETRGLSGLSAFIVEKGAPGFSVGKPFGKMGLRTSPIGEVVLEDCAVPIASRLGREGAGVAIFNAEMEWERGCLFASQLGAMEYQLERCIRHTRGGNPSGEESRLVDMKMRIELARLMLYKVAWMKMQGRRAPVEASIAKLYASESYVASSLDAILLHGGSGCICKTEVERDLRDAVAGRIYSGTSEIQRNIIAGWLGFLQGGKP